MATTTKKTLYIGDLPETAEQEYDTAVGVARKLACELRGVMRQAERFGAEGFGGSDSRVDDAAKIRRVVEAIAHNLGAKPCDIYPEQHPQKVKRKEQETHGD